MSKQIGYLGPRGTFTEQAARIMFPKEKLVSFPTIYDCMDACLEGRIDFSVVPMENTIEGSVPLTIDYFFHEEKLPIVAEVVMPIEQHLFAHPDQLSQWANAEKIYSHPHAISQCRQFLRKFMPNAQLIPVNSTAAAAEWVKDHPEEACLAIGNELAAEYHELATVQKNIHDYPNNETRFIVLNRDNVKINGDKSLLVHHKTTFMITLPADYPGALHQVLSAFSWRKLNLSKIESRPMKTGLGQYFFIIDIEKELDTVLVPGVKAEIEALGCKVNILGSYPCFAIKNKQTISLFNDN